MKGGVWLLSYVLDKELIKAIVTDFNEMMRYFVVVERGFGIELSFDTVYRTLGSVYKPLHDKIVDVLSNESLTYEELSMGVVEVIYYSPFSFVDTSTGELVVMKDASVLWSGEESFYTHCLVMVLLLGMTFRLFKWRVELVSDMVVNYLQISKRLKNDRMMMDYVSQRFVVAFLSFRNYFTHPAEIVF